MESAERVEEDVERFRRAYLLLCSGLDDDAVVADTMDSGLTSDEATALVRLARELERACRQSRGNRLVDFGMLAMTVALGLATIVHVVWPGMWIASLLLVLGGVFLGIPALLDGTRTRKAAIEGYEGLSPPPETWESYWAVHEPERFKQAYELLMMEQPRDRVVGQVIRAGMKPNDAEVLVEEAWQQGRNQRRREGSRDIATGLFVAILGFGFTAWLAGFPQAIGTLIWPLSLGAFGVVQVVSGTRKRMS